MTANPKHYPRTMIVTVTPDAAQPFTVETFWRAPTGRSCVLGRMAFSTWPLVTVGRVADRADYRVIVRVSELTGEQEAARS